MEAYRQAYRDELPEVMQVMPGLGMDMGNSHPQYDDRYTAGMSSCAQKESGPGGAILCGWARPSPWALRR